MPKIKMDLLDPLDNSSGEDEDEIMGMDDPSFGTGETEKKLLETTGGEDISFTNNYFREPMGNAVAYRVVMSDDSGSSSLQSQTHYAASSNGQSTQTIPVLANSVNGQLYVIGNSELFTGANKQSKSREASKLPNIIKKRDDRRRATHNEVERRRRDKINNWIFKLAKLIPRNDTTDKIGMESKGGILAKACEYITELKEHNDKVDSLVKTNLKLTNDYNVLMTQCKVLKKANLQMKNLLSSRGISYNTDSSDSPS